MKQTKPRKQLLTGKILRSVLKKDTDRPSLLRFVVLESLEWLLYLAILFILVTVTRPLWQPVVNFISSFF